MASHQRGISGDNTKDSKWYFTKEQLQNSPSRSQGINAEYEIQLRQKAAYLIQEMGLKLEVNQLCINTATVYMHRFYACHSFKQFHLCEISLASLFLAAKTEEQPRKMESVIHVLHHCVSGITRLSMETYTAQAHHLILDENILLQTFEFNVTVDHPHAHVVKICALVNACEDLAEAAYFLASSSLRLTTMCLQYRPTVVACFCIYLASKWTFWEIPQSSEGKDWFYYVDKNVTMELLEQLTDEFTVTYAKSPERIMQKDQMEAMEKVPSSTMKDISTSARSDDVHSSGPQHRSSSHHRQN